MFAMSKLVFAIIILLHWLACLWNVVPMIEGTEDIGMWNWREKGHYTRASDKYYSDTPLQM
jgi:hypothetical protein